MNSQDYTDEINRLQRDKQNAEQKLKITQDAITSEESGAATSIKAHEGSIASLEPYREDDPSKAAAIDSYTQQIETIKSVSAGKLQTLHFTLDETQREIDGIQTKLTEAESKKKEAEAAEARQQAAERLSAANTNDPNSPYTE